MNFPAYTKYKPSGIEWLGEVPEHWTPERFGYLFRFFSGGTPSTNVSAYWDGELSWVSAKDMKSFIITDTSDHISETAILESATCKLPTGSLLIVNRSGILKHSLPVAVIASEMSINQDIRGCVPRVEVNSMFIAYLILGNQKALLSLWRQQGATVESLSFELVKTSKLFLPQAAEQNLIVKFLDAQTARLDELLEKKRALVDRLKEQRSALISHTVTRGLNPDVPLKPSGIEWLGDIPEHWVVQKLKQKCSKITDGAHISPDLSSPDRSFVSTVDIKSGCIDFDSCLKTSNETYEYLVRTGCKPVRGDVLFSKDGTVGRTAIVDFDIDFVVASSLVILRPIFGLLDSRYLDFWLNNEFLQQEVDLSVSGAALRRISIIKVSNLPLFLPPLAEQTAIADYLDEETGKIDQMVEKVEEAIDKLVEYRSALISAAVTGKIDVREVSA